MSSTSLILLNSERKMPLLKLPVRSVLVELSNARVLISPGSRLKLEQLREAGPVHELIANNCFHGAGIQQAQTVFPQARSWSPKPLNETDWPIQIYGG